MAVAAVAAVLGYIERVAALAAEGLADMYRLELFKPLLAAP